MCLAVPGKLVEWIRRDPPFDTAMLEFGGVRRQVSMACLPEAEVGDYCLVHAGMAISRIAPEEAADLLENLREIALDDQLEPEGFRGPDQTRPTGDLP